MWRNTRAKRKCVAHHTRYNIQYGDRAGMIYCFYTKSYTSRERRLQNELVLCLLCLFQRTLRKHIVPKWKSIALATHFSFVATFQRQWHMGIVPSMSHNNQIVCATTKWCILKAYWYDRTWSHRVWHNEYWNDLECPHPITMGGRNYTLYNRE